MAVARLCRIGQLRCTLPRFPRPRIAKGHFTNDDAFLLGLFALVSRLVIRFVSSTSVEGRHFESRQVIPLHRVPNCVLDVGQTWVNVKRSTRVAAGPQPLIICAGPSEPYRSPCGRAIRTMLPSTRIALMQTSISFAYSETVIVQCVLRGWRRSETLPIEPPILRLPNEVAEREGTRTLRMR